YGFNRNSFQLELFFDGRVRLTYLGIDTPRALVGLSAGGGLPSDFVASVFAQYGSCSPGMDLVMASQAQESAGQLQATVRIPKILDHDLVVNLTSLNPGLVAVPATITVPSGRDLADFTMTVHDNSELDGTKVVRITASSAEFRDASA